MADGLYSKIRIQFDQLLAGGTDPNSVSCEQWQSAASRAIKAFIEDRVTVQCAWIGVDASSSPDPITSDTWHVKVTDFNIIRPTSFQDWVQSIQSLVIANTYIDGTGNSGVTLSSPMKPLILSGLSISQNTLGSKSTVQEAWDYIGNCILSWITSSPAGATGTGSHLVYTGTATQTTNISS